MLSLIFSRAKKRNLIGLLALGEWGPPTGAPAAITGSGATQQARQQDLASGTVLEPVVTFVGGGGGGVGFPQRPAAIVGDARTRQPRQQSVVDAHVEFPAYAVTRQRPQETLAAGDVIPAIFGECHTGQLQPSRVRGELQFIARVVGSQPLQESIARAQELFVGCVESGHGHGRSDLDAQLQFSGAACSQSLQESAMQADMVDTELEMITALLMEAA